VKMAKRVFFVAGWVFKSRWGPGGGPVEREVGGVTYLEHFKSRWGPGGGQVGGGKTVKMAKRVFPGQGLKLNNLAKSKNPDTLKASY